MADAADTDSEEEFEVCRSTTSLNSHQVLTGQIGEANKLDVSNIVIEDPETVDTDCKGSTQQSSSSGLEGDCKSRCCGGCLNPHGDKVKCRQDTLDSTSISATSSHGECYISRLPCEILLYIFSFLNKYDLCINVSLVCTAWRDLAKDPTLWTHLVFSYQHRVDGDQVRRLLKGSPHLLSLEMQSREDGGDLLLQAAASCTKLRELTVKFCDGLTDTVFKSLVENCSDLRYLNVEGSRVCNSECYFLMAEFRQLRYLNLSHCQFLDNLGLIAIAKQCKYLEYLDIDGITNIYDSSVMCLTRELSHRLKCLFLDGEHLTDALYKTLQKCTLLEKLGVSFCEEMTDAGLSGIHGLKHLTWLKLRKGSQLTPNGLTRLFQSGGLQQLAYLNLGECCLMDDKVLKALSFNCPKLVHLVLHWCWEVTDVGISAVVACCPRIRILDLVGVVQITGIAFLNIPTALPELLILDLEQCNTVDDKILQGVVSQMPSLRVFDYWGDPVMPSDSDDDDDNSTGNKGSTNITAMKTSTTVNP
ncbi:F-box/LRR-repeat protein 20-like isoform X1 [Homarus americanus]|uniref:F-box/LRR-repeat protein 2-like n=1 Tax=Homarus americanus TaxID=6706 RepID=A0A8J5JGL5_HOMAM|nr:F-box/LRR-repeat protein 20-like isoform X1 [Homarus americanus]KAG7157365.1 F-box/LRR-repeat protein 2-like [Homarus americanus]